MSDINLKVSQDILKSKANEIQSQIIRLESAWNRLEQLVKNTKVYWIGDASNSHQRQFQDYQDDMRRLLKRLKEHPEDLLKMADVYEKSERSALQIAQTLPEDVIV